MAMLDTVLDGPSLRQERRLITEVAGPRLRELAAPRADALPAGWSGGAPVYTVAAGGGIPVDVDGNSFIDLGSGIAVTTVGNAAPPIVARAADQLARHTNTCFLATQCEPYIEVAEILNRLIPAPTTNAPCCSTPAVKPSSTPERPPSVPPWSSSITRSTADRC